MIFLDSSIFLPRNNGAYCYPRMYWPLTPSASGASTVPYPASRRAAWPSWPKAKVPQRPRPWGGEFFHHGSPTEVGGVIFCIEIWLCLNMFHVKIEGLLSCESASWSSKWIFFGTTVTLLKPQNHQDNMHHGSNKNHCSASWRAKRGRTSWIGWYSLKRNHAAAAIQRWSSAIFCHRVSQAEVVSVGSNM